MTSLAGWLPNRSQMILCMKTNDIVSKEQQKQKRMREEREYIARENRVKTNFLLLFVPLMKTNRLKQVKYCSN